MGTVFDIPFSIGVWESSTALSVEKSHCLFHQKRIHGGTLYKVSAIEYALMYEDVFI